MPRQSLSMHRVYFIIGCTACGKGAVGRAVARRVGGRIISVDSMKVYRRMDIGTAKPTEEIRREIPHFCIDMVEPSERFSVADYLHHADAAIDDIRRRGSVPLAVGGTSLYIKALSEGLFAGPAADSALREELTRRADSGELPAMHDELCSVDPAAAERIHPNDRKRIIRALEVYKAAGRPISGFQTQWDGPARRHDCVFIGLRRDKADLHGRINLRVKRMIDSGLVDEVRGLLSEPAGLSPQAAQAVGYAELIDHLGGRRSMEDAVEAIKINTRKLAKKQRTWHRRFEGVTWFDIAPDEPPEATAERVLCRVGFEAGNPPGGKT